MAEADAAAEKSKARTVMAERNEDAQKFIKAQERSQVWRSLPNSKPVSFENLRHAMCRWPLGDPHDYETFRFCGTECSSGATYCTAHAKIAVSTGSRPRMQYPVDKNQVYVKQVA
jgi:hypothetical protein